MASLSGGIGGLLNSPLLLEKKEDRDPASSTEGNALTERERARYRWKKKKGRGQQKTTKRNRLFHAWEGRLQSRLINRKERKRLSQEGRPRREVKGGEKAARFCLQEKKKKNRVASSIERDSGREDPLGIERGDMVNRRSGTI